MMPFTTDEGCERPGVSYINVRGEGRPTKQARGPPSVKLAGRAQLRTHRAFKQELQQFP